VVPEGAVERQAAEIPVETPAQPLVETPAEPEGEPAEPVARVPVKWRD